MQTIPRSKHDWFRLIVFPFKAYIIIGPMAFYLVGSTFPHSRHDPPEAAGLLLFPLFPCALVLLVAALVFAVFGPKGHAVSYGGFAVASFLILKILLPLLAVA